MPRGLINSLGILFYIFKTNVISAQNYQPLDYVLQLADIARPTERFKVVKRLRRNLLTRNMVFIADMLNKFGDKQFNILTALSERRYLYHDYTKTVI
jgi:hypothetical protein